MLRGTTLPDIDPESTEKGISMTEPAYTTASRTKYVILATTVILAFFAAYGYAVSRNAPAPSQPVTFAAAQTGAAGAAGAG